ncbi:MAG: TetR/AcrR family transcriptional regulator [Paenibacillus macerans]|uniref:Bacterial regulatory s, tetR family protein n=1 Tax=Paenibacillus macerans TaxID=44252 RepID=A0A090Y9N6_PAEMA|nr:TetR/AcrR family transcriptional regulator [Paenibacillus macerans]KFM94527.1 bacterial regulatory s, tetR family protein [Paenibacillus macerans]MBS5909571.1 TetR/AcrR family transcriptional regulator [Paenibacillus macerans]MCY7557238.1 TetR/AcrR family transcriptional regulator [Paenibacillus macerans]MDU5947159.1 TetR/AcrR family transcriptional regulator [Paenibacillus macerans]MDU7471840.1 TetR/AcrR family transcriptional regulator [Paenibacillus macerans]
MKQEERRQQTTRRLIDATKALIEEKGCYSITMQDIMDRSGLSKGAIFHYVKSKDEIFVWLLQEVLEETNRRFMNEVEHGRRNFDDPMQKIKESIIEYESPYSITNKVLLYLLGKEEDPLVAEALKEYYDRSVYLSKVWIETGQKYGVIPEMVDAEKTAEMFTLMTLGFRIRSSIPNVRAILKAQDLTALMTDILNPRRERE